MAELILIGLLCVSQVCIIVWVAANHKKTQGYLLRLSQLDKMGAEICVDLIHAVDDLQKEQGAPDG